MMELPSENIIFNVAELANQLILNNEGVSLKPHIRKNYCSLVPSTQDLSLIPLLEGIRKKYRKLYFWVDSKVISETEEICVINFFQKHL